jgi:hypothetical protein
MLVDSTLDDEQRRRELHAGRVFMFSPLPGSRALCERARQLAREALAPHEPHTARFHLEAEEHAAALRRVHEEFPTHAESRRLMQAVLNELGCNLTKTFFDAPRLVVEHEGTERLAPESDLEIHFWLPVEIAGDTSFTLRPRALQPGARDPFAQLDANPASPAPKVAPVASGGGNVPLCLPCPPGGIVMFAASRHSALEVIEAGNTRFSVGFRTVHLDDLRMHGVAMEAYAGFVRASDFTALAPASQMRGASTPATQ